MIDLMSEGMNQWSDTLDGPSPSNRIPSSVPDARPFSSIAAKGVEDLYAEPRREGPLYH